MIIRLTKTLEFINIFNTPLVQYPLPTPQTISIPILSHPHPPPPSPHPPPTPTHPLHPRIPYVHGQTELIFIYLFYELI